MDDFDVLRHNEAAMKGLFICDECDFESKYKSSLNRHLLIHERETEESIIRHRPASSSSASSPMPTDSTDEHADADEHVDAGDFDDKRMRSRRGGGGPRVWVLASMFLLASLSWVAFFFATQDCTSNEIYCVHSADSSQAFAVRAATTFAVFLGGFNVLYAASLVFVRRRHKA